MSRNRSRYRAACREIDRECFWAAVWFIVFHPIKAFVSVRKATDLTETDESVAQ